MKNSVHRMAGKNHTAPIIPIIFQCCSQIFEHFRSEVIVSENIDIFILIQALTDVLHQRFLALKIVIVQQTRKHK
jgi:hypothetical protein